MYNHVSNVSALANNSSASVFKPQLAKLVCSVSVMWPSIDRLHSLMGRFSVLKYLALEPHSPPTSAPYSHCVVAQRVVDVCYVPHSYSRALATKNFIPNENRAIKKSMKVIRYCESGLRDPPLHNVLGYFAIVIN